MEIKITVVLSVLIGILILACSNVDVPSADPTPNVNATVEAQVAQEPVATLAVDTPTPAPTLTPIPTLIPTPRPTRTAEPTPILSPTQTPVPTLRTPLVSTDILEVPLTIHLLTEMPMKIRNASGDGFCEDCELMDSWITQDQISNEIMPEVNRIYEQANIRWDIQEFIVEPAAQRSYAEAADWLSLSDRSSDNAERISKYFDLIPASTVDETMVNLYFVTFIGNTRQGRANKCSSNLPFGLSDPPFNMSDPSRACSLTINGQWSNKYLPDGAPPEKRVLLAPEGTPSLAMTVAHELGHTLDLSHPDSGEINLMQGYTSGHNLTDAQIFEAREFAFTYHDVTSTPHPALNPTPTPTPNAGTLDMLAEARERARSKQEASDWFDQGVSSYQSGLYEDAITNFDKAIEIAPGANYYGWRSVSYSNLGQYQNAVNDNTKAIQLEPNARRYRNRGINYGNLGQHQYALDDYTTAIQLDPDYAAAYSSRGVSYRNLGQYQNAVNDNTKAIQLEPNATRYRDRGINYGNLGQHQYALDDYTTAIQLDPDYAAAYNSRGYSNRRLGQYQRAIEDYDKAIQIDPGYAAAYNKRGLSYHDLGEYRSAIADYDVAISLDPDEPDYFINRGLSYNWLGTGGLGATSEAKDIEYNEQAVADFSKAIELDPLIAKAYHYRSNSYDWLINASRGKLWYYQLMVADNDKACSLDSYWC